jgi:TRAP-type C4-dicarboxylate transport system permease large subunit
MVTKRAFSRYIASVSTIGMILLPAQCLSSMDFRLNSHRQTFIAGIAPALMIALLFMAVIAGWVIIKPDIAPKGEKATWKERLAAVPEALVILIVFAIVIGGMITVFLAPQRQGQ